MVQWENTDRNDTVKHVWTRHMIHMDLEPAAIKRHHVVICTGNEVSLTIDSPVWGTIYERYIFRVFFSRRHEKYRW